MNKYLIALLILLTGCRDFGRRKDAKDFVPGTYKRTIDQPYARGNDTLVITHLLGHAYQVIKRSDYRRIVHNKLLPVEHHVIKLNVLYDEATGQLQEQQRGKIFSFDKKHQTVVSGDLIYNRIK
jgi:hypothetical protein